MGVRHCICIVALLLFAVTAQAQNVASGGNWEDAGTWSGGVPGSGDDVVIPAGVTVTNNGLGTYAINSLTITGTLTHAGNVNTEANKISLNVAGNVTVAAGGTINVKGKGYSWLNSTGYGPGFSVGRCGAAHGGQGGSGIDGSPGLTTYGSVTNPVSLGSGSGGRSGHASGSAGGGAVRLVVGGTMTVEGGGSIDAEGNFVSDQSTAAGGSVNIAANAFSGTGTINAKGGAGGSNAGTGGGGRIALVAGSGDATQFDTLTITATAGAAAGRKGAAGTIYLKVPAQSYGTLLVKNHGSAANNGATTAWESEANRFDEIITTNYGVLAVGPGGVLDFSGTTLISDSRTTSITSRVTIDSDNTNRFVLPSSFTNAGCLSQSGTNVFAFPGDVTVSTNGIFTHESTSSASSENDRLNLSVAGNLTVDVGGAITVKSKGYGHNGAGTAYGPGASTGRGGSAYGGVGGNGGSPSAASSTTYGSPVNPVNYGSGCAGRNNNGSSGGGAAILQVAGTATINGVIDADGGTISDYSAAAGGSISITANAFSGTGTIRAKGGRGLSNGGGAGGGRIALKVGSGGHSQFATLTITAASGMTGNGTYVDPTAGTIYLESPADGGDGWGTVWIDNEIAPSPSYTNTPIPAVTNFPADELERATIIATNYAQLVTIADATVGNLMVKENCFWTLGTNVLTVQASEHDLDDKTISGPGNTGRVDNYANINWVGSGLGTLLIIR